VPQAAERKARRMARVLRVRETAKRLALAEKAGADARAADIAAMAARLDRLALGYAPGHSDDADMVRAKAAYRVALDRAAHANDHAGRSADAACAAALDRLRDADRARRVAELLRDRALADAAQARRRRDGA
jgi:hypothetical protein